MTNISFYLHFICGKCTLIQQVFDKGPEGQNLSLTPGPLTVKKFKLKSQIIQNFKELKRYLQGTISGAPFRFIYIFYTNLLSLSYTHLTYNLLSSTHFKIHHLFCYNKPIPQLQLSSVFAEFYFFHISMHSEPQLLYNLKKIPDIISFHM